jgi:broad-specificity NMP kinase
MDALMDAAFVKRVAQERVDKELRGLKWNLEKVPENGSTESSPAA